MRSLLLALPLLAGTAPGLARPLPSEPVELALAGGESHVWTVPLAVDDYLAVTVEQRGVDVLVEALAPGGETLAEVDSPNGRHGHEPLTVIAAVAGEHRVVVSSPSADAPVGRYEIRAAGPRPATGEDRRRHEAERAQLAAHRAGSPRSAENFRESVRRYREVETLWRELGDRARQAEVLYRMGGRLRVLGERDEAREAIDRALAIYTELDDRPGQARCWTQHALIAWAGSDTEAALAACRSALALWEELDDPTQLASALNTLGLISMRAGRPGDALDAYRRALEIFRETEDPRSQAVALNNIGGVLDQRGDPLGALEHYGEALELARAQGERAFEAEALHNQGFLYFRLGQAQEALRHYRRALPLFEALGDRRRQAAVLGSLGLLHLWLRDFDRALEELGAALELEKEIGDSRGQAWTLYSLGTVYLELGQTERALLAYRKSLELLGDAGDPASRAAFLTRLGSALVRAGEPRRALDALGEAHGLQEELGDPWGLALGLIFRGRVHAELGDAGAASADFEQAETLSAGAGALRIQAEALHELAGAALGRNALADAERHAREALRLVESARARIAGNDLRASYFTSIRDVYERAVEILVTRAREENDPSHAARAFEIAGRARARGLHDQLREVRLGLRHGVDGELLERERRLRFELDHRAERRRRALESAGRTARAAELESEIEGRLRELADVQAEIRAASPRYAALSEPAAISLAEVQDEILDPGTVLLEYFLGAERSFLWRVTTASLEVFDLPPRAAIEALVRDVHRHLGDPDPRHAGDQRRSLAELSRVLLGSFDLDAGARLAIVADGALHYLPFATLTANGKPLVVDHEIVHLPSAAVLAELRRPLPGRPAVTSELALFADPVFTIDDPRVTTRSDVAAGPATTPEAPGVVAVRGDEPAAPLGRLGWTRREAEAIVAAVRDRVPAERLFVAMDFASRVEAVFSGAARGARVLHFATHGEVDAARPRLSALVLSRVDEEGRPRDGFLRLHDVYSLDLAADLVVLSGCRTALGREILGEGLQSLTRGFFYAGAPRVVASLWAVQDQATAELMRHFYAALFERELTPAAALRAAQVALWEDRRFRDPYYWGAFVLQGDWR